jgi:hypothetical protein
MKKSTRSSINIRSFAALVSLCACAALPQAVAAPMPITHVYVIQVSAPNNHAFREGVKAWHKCLWANGDRAPSLVYDAASGDLSRYAILNPHHTWGGMDRTMPGGKACRALFTTAVMPYVESAYSEITQLSPKATYMPTEDPQPAPMLWVVAFRVKADGFDRFNAGLEQFAAAAAKTHWEGTFSGYDVIGAGQGGADFLLVWPNKNWADVGSDPSPTAKQMMQSVYGKSRAQAMRMRWAGSVAESWSDGWIYDKRLSYPSHK